MINTNLKKGFQKSDPTNVPFGIEIGITTDNVQELMDKCVLFGGIVYQEASVKPWGQTAGYVRDIDGFLIEICTPVNA